ncbi:MAG TPA: 50S ribosomal protein L1 [Chloroflexota bacterium]|nr:50S ribosomal protein L1 [Chloroflexota bacterium]
MAKHGKQYIAAAKLVEEGKLYSPPEAVTLLKQTSFVKFDPTIELHFRLGVDPRHADQMVRGTAVLPHGTGKVVRILVFAQGDKAREAEEAGADFVGSADLVKQITEGWLGFDVAIATPDMMQAVGRLGKILGRRGLMPNPKAGTVTFDIARTIREVRSGRVEFRVDRAGLVHVPVGRLSFDEPSIMNNVAAMIEAVTAAKPTGAKGHYMRSITLTSTMAPGIPLDTSAAQALRVA